MPKDFFVSKKPRPSMSDIVSPSTPVVTSAKKEPTVSKPEKPRKSSKKRWSLILPLLIVVLVGAGYLTLRVLPRVEIKIFLKKYPLTFNEVIEAGTSVSVKLPAELFSEKRNLAMNFPATGKQNIQKKAQGKIIIYNSYSSDAQKLVADTRFLTPDNKIFRLVKAVIVPGAKIQEGKIIASTIEVEVVADQPGAEYNIGPVAKFTVPGLKGSPKYEGFYAESVQPLTGGFIGEIAVPTEKDIADAKTKLRQTLETNLKTIIFSQLPKEFKILADASEFKILKEEVNNPPAGGEKNNFSVFGEAQMKLLTFQEKDLKNMLVNQLKPQLSPGDYEVRDFQIEYGVSRSDFEKKVMSFPVKGQIIFQNKTDPELLRQQAKGKNEQELKILVFALPGLEKAQFSFWPIYVKTAPTNINKIKVVVQ